MFGFYRHSRDSGQLHKIHMYVVFTGIAEIQGNYIKVHAWFITGVAEIQGNYIKYMFDFCRHSRDSGQLHKIDV